MSTSKGKPPRYARRGEVGIGTRVKADSGFVCYEEDGGKKGRDGIHRCIPDGAIRIVQANNKGEFYVKCSRGRHFIDPERGRYVGLFLVDVPPPSLHA